MTDLAALQAARTLAIAKYSEIAANPKPDYSIDGQSVSWSAYRKSLLDEIAMLNNLIEGEDPLFEVGRAFT